MMVRTRLLLPGVLAGSLLGACATQPPVVTPVTVVANPGPFQSVEAAAGSEAQVDWEDADPRDDNACTESFAALELGRFLAPCLGLPDRDIHFAAVRTLPRSGDVFVLGSAASNPLVAALDRGARPATNESGDGFRIRMLRRDGRRVFLIRGESRTGTLYGAYALLEQLGVKFFGLGDTGTVLPATPVRLPRKLELEERPAFTTRGFWAWEPRGSRDFLLWMARNRMNLWTASDTGFIPLMKKLGFRLTGGGHTIQGEFLGPDRDYPYEHALWRGDETKPKDPYAPLPAAPVDGNHDGKLSNFEAHPEWYGLHGDRRSRNLRDESGDNYCTSNGDATRELATRIVQALADGSLRHVDALQLWMLDGGRWCECDACRAQGTPSDRLLEVARAVAEAIAAAREDGRLARSVQVAAAAYLETLSPPAPGSALHAGVTACFFPYFRCYAHTLADPACEEINRRIARHYEGWTRAAGRHGPGALAVCEYYNVGAFKSLPVVFPRVMAADLSWYHATGASGIAYMHAPTRLWGSWALNHAVLARLLWNPNRNPDTLVAEFCASFYPSTSQRMRSFYGHLEQATANITALQHCAGVYGSSVPGGRLAHSRSPVFPLQHLRETPALSPANDAPALDEIERAMRRAREEIDAARTACCDGVERGRLAEVEGRFAYGEAMFRLYAALIQTALRHREGDDAGARMAFVRAEEAAGRLRGIRELVQVASTHANARDGLEASGVVPTYEYFRKLYGGR